MDEMSSAAVATAIPLIAEEFVLLKSAMVAFTDALSIM